MSADRPHPVTHELRLFFVALQFLTRVPVPHWVGFEPTWLQACLRHFPLVGACIGTWAAAVLWAALALWPPLVAAVLSTMATVWLTGAFHEDGLADTFDALGGAVGRERALAIMKDSRIGSYGAAALMLVLVLKISVVAALVTPAGPAGAVQAGMALVWAHAVSRATPLWLVSRLPYAGDAEHAKAKPLAMQVSHAGLAVAAAWVVAISVAAAGLIDGWPSAGGSHGPRVVLVGGLASAGAAWLCLRWLRRRLGGFTGDTLGAAQQLTEAAALLAWLGVAEAR